MINETIKRIIAVVLVFIFARNMINTAKQMLR